VLALVVVVTIVAAVIILTVRHSLQSVVPPAVIATPVVSSTGPAVTQTPAEPTALSYTADTGDAAPVKITAGVGDNLPAEGGADTLSKYYGGINARRWDQVWDQYTPRYQNKHGSVDYLARAARTSRDFHVVIRSLTRINSHKLRVYVTFTSTQAGSLGPVEGETRTDWRLDYEFSKVDGVWLINGNESHSGSGHSPG
jgi:hypothetical protein